MHLSFATKVQHLFVLEQLVMVVLDVVKPYNQHHRTTRYKLLSWNFYSCNSIVFMMVRNELSRVEHDAASSDS